MQETGNDGEAYGRQRWPLMGRKLRKKKKKKKKQQLKV